MAAMASDAAWCSTAPNTGRATESTCTAGGCVSVQTYAFCKNLADVKHGTPSPIATSASITTVTSTNPEDASEA